jgi:hypothetical protein
MQGEPVQKQSWLGRNWKWVLPVGCVSLLGLIAVFVAGIILVVFGFMKSSDVYQEALAAASSSPSVIDVLGEPIEAGWYMTGTIRVSGASGTADITIPISGPRGTGTIFAAGTKRAGQWSYEVLEVEVDGLSERIDLLEAPEP